MGTLPTQIAFDTKEGLPTAGGLVVPSPGQLRLKVSEVLPCDLIANSSSSAIALDCIPVYPEGQSIDRNKVGPFRVCEGVSSVCCATRRL